jgi:crotonobetainyl-CoA:carnitine CoA-transferase CaiB-like acyl-CoA transferase
MPSAQHAPFSALRVIDASSSVAGQYAGKLFSGYGAEVILVELASGAPTRRISPNPYLFRHLNGGKQVIGLELAEERDLRILSRLCGTADIILRDARAPWPVKVTEKQIDCTVSDFPRAGPTATWKGTEMIHQALSGAMAVTGDPDQKPLYGIGQRAYYAAGVTAFTSCVVALLERLVSNRGQGVAINVFESLAAMGQNIVSQYSYNGGYMRRGRYPGFLAVLECSDAWVVLFALRNWDAVCELFGVPQLTHDLRFAHPTKRLENWPTATALLQEAARTISAPKLVEEAQRRKVSIEQVMTIEGLVSSAQFRRRGMVVARKCNDGATHYALGPVFRIASVEYNADPCSHALARTGIRNAAGCASTETPSPWSKTGNDQSGPLRGVRVLDFTTAWAGPMATRGLAYFGAQVIKIEAPSRLDSWRGTESKGGVPARYPDGNPGEKPYNRNVLFNTQCHDKWSLSLDLKRPGAIEVIYDLAREADLVVANFSNGALDRMGVGFDRLVQINPEICVVEMPAFGEGGPMERHVGMGNTMEAASGMPSLIGYGDGRPVLTGTACMDPIGGVNATAAAVTALWLRAQQSRGVKVEVAQTEAAEHWIGEYILEYLRTGTTWKPCGNFAPDYAPHDAYRAAGTDQWVAVAARTDDEWHALCKAIGRPDLAGDERYATFAKRWQYQDELRAPIEAWTRARPKRDAAVALQVAGVPAAPVNSGPDIVADPTLKEIGFIVTITHPEAGRHDYPSLAYHLARTPGRIRNPAPCFGQHNGRVLGDVLHATPERIRELYDTQAVTDEPRRGSGLL